MNVDERVLREALVARSEQPAIPSVPVEELLTGGRQLVRRRHRRLALASGIAAAVVAVSAGLVLRPGGSGSPGPTSPTPPVPTGGARTLGDLPRGEPPPPYFEKGVLHVGGRTVDVESRVTLSIGGGTVVSWTAARDDRATPVRVLDTRTGDLGPMIGEARARPVVSADGRIVAWEDDNPDGTARVRLWDIRAGAERGTVSFPFTPSCCDNPLGLAGIDGDGRVYGTGGGKTWVGSPGGTPVLLAGLGSSSWIVEVGVDHVIVSDGPKTWLGHLDGSRLVDDLTLPSGQLALSPTGTMLAHVDDEDHDRTGPTDPEEHVWVQGLPSSGGLGVVQMRLPGDVSSASGLLWESDSDLLVQVALRGDPAGKYAWLRCAAETGQCELATTFRTELPGVPLR